MESLTVFTPAYNRAHTLGRTYKSLCAQSNKDFIWMVVDDGSTDIQGSWLRAGKKRTAGFRLYISIRKTAVCTRRTTRHMRI